MKPEEIKKKARAKAAGMDPVRKQYAFTDTAGVEGACSVMSPGTVHHYGISKTVAQNLINKHGDALPFAIVDMGDGQFEIQLPLDPVFND